ncbi:MFS transporter [Nocardia sp. NPDC020380]|uniref:MFS transporter n=1 Tax=Nocardia sp. NPDC020380 TaxID=3364309 RepID=UPI0037927046
MRLAPSPGWFLFARLLMGLAGAGITVMALSALTVLFDEDERPKAVGVFQAANFLALPLGPILGGWMLSHFWWGWMFLLNVPVVLLGLAVGGVLVPESRSEQRPGMDPIGTAASMIGLVAVTYGLVKAGEDGWSDAAAVACMIAGVVVLAGFFVWERSVARRGGAPLIPPVLFRSKAFASGAALAGLAGLGMIGLLFTMPQYFQAVHGLDALGSGLRLLPLVAGLLIGALPAAWLTRAIGSKLTVALGFTLLASGAGLGATTQTSSSTAFGAVWMAILCAGTGMALSAATSAAITTLSVERSGIGSAVVQAFNKTGGPVGTAVMGSILAAGYQRHLDLSALPPGAGAEARKSVYGGMAVAQNLGSPSFGRSVQDALVYGLDISMLAAAGIAVAGVVLTLLFLPGLRTYPDPDRPKEPAHVG